MGRLAVLLSIVLTPTLALARAFTAGSLRIEQPWARATPPGARVGAGYLTVVNQGAKPDRLVGGTLEIASGFELHRMAMDGDVMTMRPTGLLEIAPGSRLVLEPSATHIMFNGLKRGLNKGEAIHGTLVFEQAGTVPVLFMVGEIGARVPPLDAANSAMPGMDMH